jgi:hypothetical protein
MNFGLAKDGGDKGRIFGYSTHSGGESHHKSKESYEGYYERFQAQGYNPEYAVVDTCCNGVDMASLEENDHPLSHFLKLKQPPKADAFHVLEGVHEKTQKCDLSVEFERDLHSVIFEDASETAKDIVNQWLEYYDKIKKYGSLESDFPYDRYRSPSLFERKLIALSTCFEDLLSPHLAKSKNLKDKRRELIKLAIKHCTGAYNPFVPQIFRERDEMKRRLNEFLLKWIGYGLSAKEDSSNFQYEFIPISGRPECFPSQLQLEVYSDQLYKSAINDKVYIVLVRGDNDGFIDSNGVLWRPTTSSSKFGKSKIFQKGKDGKVLGKEELPQQLLNLARHIWSGCLDYRHLGDSIYQDASSPVLSKKSRYFGLVKVETAAGQNAVENFFKFLNEVKHGVASYSNEECEVRVSLHVLSRNYSVDVKHRRLVAPTLHIWYWSRINDFSKCVFGKAVFEFRGYHDYSPLPTEIFIGFNTFRFETFIQNKIPLEEAKRKCSTFLLPSTSKFRWPIVGEFVLQSKTDEGKVAGPLPLQAPTVMNDTAHSVAEEVYLRSAKKPCSLKQSPKNLRALETSDEATTREEQTVLNEIISDMLVKVADSAHKVSPKQFTQLVAEEFNTTALENALIGHSVPNVAKDLRKLLSPKAVDSHITKITQGFETVGRKRKRSEQKNKTVEEKYPLTLDMIVEGQLTFVEAGKYFSKLKDGWKKKTCSLKLGRSGSDKILRGTFPTSFLKF